MQERVPPKVFGSMRVEVNLTLVRAKPRFAFYCPARHLVGFDKVS